MPLPNASSVTVGVEVQPVTVNGEGVSTSLNRGSLWLTQCPLQGIIGARDLGHGEVSTCPDELPDGQSLSGTAVTSADSP